MHNQPRELTGEVDGEEITVSSLSYEDVREVYDYPHGGSDAVWSHNGSIELSMDDVRVFYTDGGFISLIDSLVVEAEGYRHEFYDFDTVEIRQSPGTGDATVEFKCYRKHVSELSESHESASSTTEDSLPSNQDRTPQNDTGGHLTNSDDLVMHWGGE